MDKVKDYRSQAQGFKCYEELKCMDDMNDLWLWALGSRCYE